MDAKGLFSRQGAVKGLGHDFHGFPFACLIATWY
jgi:hypothetical protein